MSEHSVLLDAAVEQARSGNAPPGRRAGAVIAKAGSIVARSCDRTLELDDPIAVAEVDCIRMAGRRSDQNELTLYTTRYPDMLCVGTVLQFSIGSVVIGLERISSAELALLHAKGVPVVHEPHQGCKELANESI